MQGATSNSHEYTQDLHFILPYQTSLQKQQQTNKQQQQQQQTNKQQ